MFKVRPTQKPFLSRIPPTAVGGCLRFGLPDSVSKLLRQPGRSDFNDPPTAVGGIREFGAAPVGRSLTIPQLPLGGFQAFGQMDKVESEYQLQPIRADLRRKLFEISCRGWFQFGIY